MNENGEPQHVAEQAILGMTHAEIGAYLLGLWGMPYPVIEAVCYHHHPEHISPEDGGAAEAVYIAATLEDGGIETIDMSYLERVGVADSLERFQGIVRDAGIEAHGLR
jgi:HD-like signal output (HDOD) protein